MFWRKKKKADSPEVKEAKEERDVLMAEVKGAVERVDQLQDELLEEYAAANNVEAHRKREESR